MSEASLDQLADLDIPLILESLGNMKLAFESTEYPTYELKREQIDRVEKAIAQVRAIRDRSDG